MFDKTGRPASIWIQGGFLSKGAAFAGYLAVFLGVLLASQFLLGRVGLEVFLFALVGVFAGSIYAVISFRDLTIPFLLLILAVAVLRFFWSIRAPILPDLFFDRIMLIWLAMVFMVKFFAERRKLRGPYLLDVIILVHGIYIMSRVLLTNKLYFHSWAVSIMMPYLAYFFAKNIMSRSRQVHWLFLLLLLVGVYYNVTAIAEKYHWNWLIYPKYIALPHVGFIGRSYGPFHNPGIFGNAMGMILPIHLYFISITRKSFLKLPLFISMALGVVGLFFTYTRGSWLAAMAGMAVVVLLNRKHYLRTLLPLAAIAPLIAIFILGAGQDKFLKERVENNDTVGSRVGTMVTALRVWRDHPFLGCGSYGYKEYRDNYIEPIEAPFLGTVRFSQFRNTPAHDMYLGPLAEDGLVGMGMQLTIYYLALSALLTKYRRGRESDYFIIFLFPIFAGIMANYLVGGLTISYRHTSILGVLFYMSAGIVYGYEPDQEAEKEMSLQQSPEGRE